MIYARRVGINTGEPQNWGALEFRRCLGTGSVADPKIHALPQHVKFGSSACTTYG